MRIKLLPQSPAVIRFEICSQTPDGETQMHCQGKVLVLDAPAADTPASICRPRWPNIRKA